MIIEKLQLRNLGIYAGEMTIDLTPASPEKPVILVGGLNGRGKTTLRNAILLCLHGRNAQCTNRGSKGYNQYLASLICRTAKQDESTSVTLTYHRKVAGKVQRLEVTRSWDKVQDDIEEQFSVHVLPDENAMEIDPALATNWNEHIEGYFPSSLASLFFFDGEDILRLADKKETRELIRSAIDCLLGFNVVARLEADLSKYIGKHEGDKNYAKELQAFKDAESKLKEALAEATKCEQEFAHARKEEQKAVKIVEDSNKRYEDAGGNLFEASKDIKDKEEALTVEVENLKDQYRSLAEGPAFLLLTEKLLKTARTQAESESKVFKSVMLADHDEKRDTETLSQLTKSVGSADILREIEKVLLSTRIKKPKMSELVLEADEKLEPKLDHCLSKGLPAARQAIKEFAEHTAKKFAELNRTRTDLLNMPDAGKITVFLNKKKEAHEALVKARANLDFHEARARPATARLVSAQNNMEEAERKFRDLREIENKLRRALEARQSVKKFMEVSTERKLAQVSDLITDAFLRLVGKVSLIQSIRISSPSLELTLTNPDGNIIESDHLSHGERQILAYAVLWGLSKASGRPLPTVIDTPMGRLDEKHRMNLAANYFHQASHQVVILSTDTEIYGKYLDAMKPGVGKMYSLEFDEKTKSTQVIEGYFA
jgi:DNA sulfur modification protein DndD